ncbi:uncharacterized protein [Aegilops tauschii subsp. strangulata]|uniref:uncharacterized protein n=1 Tax=Aegilops tauschii subsp. strangulata TaxID=200361 RepID=UPI003CC84417
MREVWNLPAENKFWFTGENWLQVVLDTENEETRAKILLLLWRYWHHREDCLRNNGRETIKGCVQFLKQYEEDLRKAEVSADQYGGKAVENDQGNCTRATAQPVCMTKRLDEKWIPLVRGAVKINTDASFLAEISESAAGVVGRDYRGVVLKSVCKRLPMCRSAEEAEARAILVGLQAMQGNYNGQVIVETDNQIIANELLALKPTRSPHYGLITYIKKCMAAFSDCSVQYVKRSRNTLAYGLAALTRSIGEQVWIANVPSSLRSLMISECTAPF